MFLSKSISQHFPYICCSLLVACLSSPLAVFAQIPEFGGVVEDSVVDPLMDLFDAKTYPGINCEAQAVTEIDLFSNLGFLMANANPNRRTVVCPVVRDNTRNLDGTHAAYVHVSNPAGRTTECSLFSMDKFNVLVDSDTASTSTSGNVTLYLDVDASAVEGFYGITCRLPQNAAVHSYEVREFMDTDSEFDNPFQLP